MESSGKADGNPNPIDIDLIKLAHDTHRAEIMYHREVMSKAVQWTTTVHLAMAGAILALGEAKWASFGQTGQWLVAGFSLIVTVFVVLQIIHSADGIDSNAKMVVKTNNAMGFFDNHDEGSLYPKTWLEWGKSKKAGYYVSQYVLVTCSLAAAVNFFSLVF